MEKHIIILSTSIGGSTMVFKSISLIVGGWPSISMISEIIKNKTYDELSYYFWIYLAGIAVLSIVSSIV
jgi:hypothetical protein